MIEDRLKASLKYDAINGNDFERGVVIFQIKEAIHAIEILRDLVAQQVEEIGWQFKENKRLRDVLSKLPDEDEIEDIIIEIANAYHVKGRLCIMGHNFPSLAKAIVKRIGVEG